MAGGRARGDHIIEQRHVLLGVGPDLEGAAQIASRRWPALSLVCCGVALTRRSRVLLQGMPVSSLSGAISSA